MTSRIDWKQVVVNLETLLELEYNYGLAHDLVIAKFECAKQEDFK